MQAVKPRHWPKQRKPTELIEEMIKEGAEDDEIIDELGVSANHIQRVRKKLKDDATKTNL